MSRTQKSTIFIAGLAMFSMFFGAGNVVFPLTIGQYAQDKNFFAIAGMLITAIGVPFAGLIGMTLFNGDYKRFFERIGNVPGFLVALIIMGLIGPFGAMPRCIALSYSTIQTFLPGISLPLFSTISCVIIWLFTFKRTTIVDTLGYFLTPVLLGSLAIITIVGIFTAKETSITDLQNWDVFLTGLKDGYQTMDLLGAFFFSSVVIVSLKAAIHVGEEQPCPKMVLFTTLKASCIGAFLLSITYIGFSYVAAFHSTALADVSSSELISKIAIHTLGPSAAIIACIAVSMACLTTAIALAAVFAEFIHKDISNNKLSYNWSLILTLLVTFFVSTLHFTGIVAFLAPILQVMYPSLIVLTFCNIAYKLFGFKMIKTPVLVTFLISIGAFFW